MTSFLSQLNETNVLPGHIIVLTTQVGFVGPAKNILIHMTSIGKQFPEPTISILEYFFQSTEIAKNTLELSLIKVTSRNDWLKGTSEPVFTCSKLTIETLEQGVKYVQS